MDVNIYVAVRTASVTLSAISFNKTFDILMKYLLLIPYILGSPYTVLIILFLQMKEFEVKKPRLVSL